MRNIQRYRFVFHGQVQGVGFRWRARMAANALGLTGYVRNNWDGSVTMEVQGSEAAIERMLSEIDSGSFIRIEDIEKKPLPLVAEERAFRVTGY